MASQITNYQCPACTGPLHFASGSGKLECEYCGSAYDVAEIECNYTYNQFGWKNYDDIHNAKIVKVKGGYMIDLPEPVEFE